jgi:hypothetical protein
LISRAIAAFRPLLRSCVSVVLTLCIDDEVVRLVLVVAVPDAGEQEAGDGILKERPTERRSADVREWMINTGACVQCPSVF